MATTIVKQGTNKIIVNGLVLPKFWITNIEDNKFPASGTIPAALICYRAGNHVKIAIHDLLDTTAGTENFAYTFTAMSGVFVDLSANHILDSNNPRIKIATSSGVGDPQGFLIGDRIRIGPDGSVFLIQKINDLTGNVIELEIDQPGTLSDLTKLQVDTAIVQKWNKDADILAHRNKIHAITF